MHVTLLHDIIVNTGATAAGKDGRTGQPRKKGDNVEVSDMQGRLLIINNQAEKYQAKQKAA